MVHYPVLVARFSRLQPPNEFHFVLSDKCYLFANCKFRIWDGKNIELRAQVLTFSTFPSLLRTVGKVGRDKGRMEFREGKEGNSGGKDVGDVFWLVEVPSKLQLNKLTNCCDVFCASLEVSDCSRCKLGR